MQTWPFAYTSIAVIRWTTLLTRFLEMAVSTRINLVASCFILKLALEARASFVQLMRICPIVLKIRFKMNLNARTII